MDSQKTTITRKRKVGSLLILILCVLVLVCTATVLFGVYEPDQNALGALASVCLDVICIIILILLILSLAFDSKEMNQTSKLYLGLMVGTLVAVFFDFLTWSSDGALSYGGLTYVYTISSLCCGAVLAVLFGLYLSSYMDDMYGLKSAHRWAGICVVCNLFSFVLTLILAVTNQAFIFYDGHYETGVWYDLVTAIPVLSIIYMSGYAIRHVKTIGIHDLIAVIGYIFIMILGAMFESYNSIGTTYVSVTIADIFIFEMLQNKLIDRYRLQKQQMAEQITSQYEILESMAGIYSYVNLVDFEEGIAKRFDSMDAVEDKIDLVDEIRTSLNRRIYMGIADEQQEKFLQFTDLSTLADRMDKEKIISAEFYHEKDGWIRAQYIRIGDSYDSPPVRVIYSIQNINEEKKNVEKWIRKSNTDELTGLLNRHAYEEDIAALENSRIPENLVYASIDVNSLKIVNDSFGHEAGDELILGACECMKQCFGAYGKLYRTGGDEFVAIIYADSDELDELKNDIDEVTENWHGKEIDSLAISCGYVSKSESENMTIHEMALLADKRMYEAKNRYYQKKGIDRRGQRDAHVALFALYTKILKINITDDTYQIVNMDPDEKTKEKGFADTISQWLIDFGTSGQVHPEDLDEYLAKTRLDYISSYFKSNNNSLCIFYRRKYNDGYRRVMMEMIPANDYSEKAQTLYLYVKDIE